jgi:uncharacterized protein YgbK (DUF1537 family)
VPLVLLDDDSTGAQAAAGIPIVLRPTRTALRAATARSASYLVTNSRARRPCDAATVTREAAGAVLAEAPGSRLALRGDSTLRAHFVEEHDAVCRARGWGNVPAVLVPALPSAGRVTRDGVHYVLVDGDAVPVGETEFARDPYLGYRHSHLLEWADSRSDGRFRAGDGAVIDLAAVRGPDGKSQIAAAIDRAARRDRPSVVTVDAETDGDIDEIAGGIHVAWAHGIEFVLRCGPALAATLARAKAASMAEMPAARRMVVLCGSFVERTTRQLAHLLAGHPGTMIEIDLDAAQADPVAEGRRLKTWASALLDGGSIAVVATPRVHEGGHAGRGAGDRLTAVLATVARELADEIDLLILKGGATSASIVADGLGADVVDVVGPVGHGASLWSVPVGGGRHLPTVVAPGNVGGEKALVDLVGHTVAVVPC